ncbi:protein kinase 4-like [Lytechinus pictus]|uniref:protein kinase 4-like n=1 Tax=Lytechinus pictus TaxID=7653 RepID=UPI0030BA0830
MAAGANVGRDEAYTTINNAAIAVTTTISATNATTTKSASATAITIATATTKTTPDTKPPSPQLTRYCSWRRIDQELQSQGLPVSYNKKNAKGPSNELVAEYLATVVEKQRLTCSHRYFNHMNSSRSKNSSNHTGDVTTALTNSNNNSSINNFCRRCKNHTGNLNNIKMSNNHSGNINSNHNFSKSFNKHISKN